MKPGRDNYEIWITDWLDGKLSAGDEALLLSFLEANPDIKQEAEELKELMPFTSGNKKYDFSSLKKSAGELTMSQVEYLSVAYLENDISKEQASDLKKCLEENLVAKKAYDWIQETKLTPPKLVYDRKRSLKKFIITPALIVRISAAAITTAAAVTLFFILNKTPEIEVIETGFVASASTTVPDAVQNNKEEAVPEIKTENTTAKVSLPLIANTEISETPVESVVPETGTVPVMAEANLTPVTPVNAPYLGNIAFNNVVNPQLADLTIETGPVLAYDDGSNRVERFVRRIFREEILKEEANTSEPLKAYEVAEAGIEGLNRLLGWEMALVKNNDEEGELKSVYFSSSLIKFNAPVKKTEPSL